MSIQTIAHVVVAIAVGGTTVEALAAAPPAAIVAQDAKAEFDKKYAAIDQNDAKALFELAVWADEHELKTDSKRLLRKVIGIDSDHAKAREMLGYEKYEGKWMTKHDIDVAKAKAEEATKLKQGLKKWKGEWVPAADYENLEKGLVKVEVEGATKWVSPVEKERIDKGMVLYQGSWVTKEEIEHLKKGEYKVGDKWLTEAEADQAHADYNNAWELEGDYCSLTTTCPHAFAQEALKQGDATVKQAYRMLGLELPKEPVKVGIVMVKDPADFSQLGRNVRDNEDALLSSEWSTFIYADENTGKFVGVSIYEVANANNPKGNDIIALGHVRFAAAASTLRNMKLAEKPPSWFSMGLACYCERYWVPFLSYEQGMKQMMKWSVPRLLQEGPLLEIKGLVEKFDVNFRSVLTAGLVVSYLFDGQHSPKVDEQWKKVLATFKAEKQKGLTNAFIKFEAQMSKDGDKELDAYASNFSG